MKWTDLTGEAFDLSSTFFLTFLTKSRQKMTHPPPSVTLTFSHLCSHSCIINQLSHTDRSSFILPALLPPLCSTFQILRLRINCRRSRTAAEDDVKKTTQAQRNKNKKRSLQFSSVSCPLFSLLL